MLEENHTFLGECWGKITLFLGNVGENSHFSWGMLGKNRTFLGECWGKITLFLGKGLLCVSAHILSQVFYGLQSRREWMREIRDI